MEILSKKTVAFNNWVLYSVIHSSNLNAAAPHVTRQLATAVNSGKFTSTGAIASLQEVIASTGWKDQCVSTLMTESEAELTIFLTEVLKLYQAMAFRER